MPARGTAAGGSTGRGAMAGQHSWRLRRLDRLRRLGRQWVHLLLGGALFMPYILLMTVAVGVVRGEARIFDQLDRQLLEYALSLPLVAGTALCFPLVRTLETAAARALCIPPGAALASGPAESWEARRRTALWFTLHTGVGALVSGATLAVPPAAAVLLAFPFSPALREQDWGWPGPWSRGEALWSAPPAGVALLLGLVGVAYGAGALLARCAPVLLGPGPADRLAEAERRTAELARRNRLARELHDSVGHALSAVTLQAGAARRVLASDPDFVREALGAIEETTRQAVAELDAVLGVLREDPDSGAAARVPSDAEPAEPAEPAEDSLDGLLRRTRAAGVQVLLVPPEYGTAADLAQLPEHVAREAYRIVQEGLTNVLRHAGPVPVRLCLAVQNGTAGTGELAVRMTNAMPERGTPAEPSPEATRGGRGLTGIRERAGLLGGTAEAGPHGDDWVLTVRLPLHRTGEPS